MIKFFFILSALIACSLLVSGQLEPQRSMSELNQLLKTSNADTDRINIRLEAALNYISVNKKRKQDIDSAFYFTNHAMKIANALNQPKYQAKCWRIYSDLLRQTGDTVKGRLYINAAIAALTHYNFQADLADAYIELGGYYDAFDENAIIQKIAYYQKAMQLYAQTNQKEKHAATLKQIADFHQLQYKDSLALEELKQALAIYQSVHFAKVQGVYDLMGYILYNAGDYKQALKYCLLAVQTAQKVNCSGAELSTIYNRVGLVYYKLLLFEDAVKYFTQSFAIAYDSHDTASMFIISPNIINSYLRLHKAYELLSYLESVKNIYLAGTTASKITFASSMVQAYLLAKQPLAAEQYAKQLTSLIKNKTDAGSLRAFYRAIIPYYLAVHKYEVVYPYLTDNEKICRENNILSGLSDNYLWWYEADSALKNYPSAIEHYKLYKEASDSALHIANNEQIDQLLIENETAKKDQAIALNKKDIELLKSETNLQQTQLKQTKLVKNITFAGITMLLVVVGLLYNRYRIKQKSNSQLQKQQKEINHKNEILRQTLEEKNQLLEEKEWLVKEIHHRVKNNLQIVISLLNTQSAYLNNEEAIKAIAESRQRMHAMSLIHEKLYQSENTATIDMKTYISELTSYIEAGYDNRIPVILHQDIADINLDLAQAIPVSLILNEAITNSFKYAFTGKESGNIYITMQTRNDKNILLEIRDDGHGLPANFDIREARSMGLPLIYGLAKQLNAQLKIENNHGVYISVEFAAYKKINIVMTH